jgi:hypothetical protein
MTKNAFLDAARKYEKPMVRFLRDMVAIPSESAEEGPSSSGSKGNGIDRRSTKFGRWLGNLLGQVGKPGKGKS